MCFWGRATKNRTLLRHEAENGRSLAFETVLSMPDKVEFIRSIGFLYCDVTHGVRQKNLTHTSD